MRKKFPLYGSWLLSLTLIFGMSTPISAQAESKTTAQVEAVQAKRQAVNSNIGISDRSSNRPMAFPDPYCEIADATDVIVEEITVVEFAGTEITNDDDDNVLIDKTDVVVEITAGDTYTISVEGNTNGDFETNIVAFIDWNQNGILDDAGEIYELGTLENSTGYDGVSVSMDITVPADAVPGQTRVRITKTYFDEFSDPIINPCGIEFDPWGMGIYPGYGQALDFTVNVGGGGTFPSPYCGITNGDDIIVHKITEVDFAGTNITNEDGVSPLIDKTDVIADVAVNDTYTLVVEDDAPQNYQSKAVAFIDWNQNGILDDAGEIYELGTLEYPTGHVSMDVTIPSDAVLGETRIRIVKTYFNEFSAAVINPCAIEFEQSSGIWPSLGQALDFTLNIEEDSGGGMAYCIPEGTNSGRYINNFSTTSGSENISNMGSGFSPDGYGDFYDTHTVAQAQGEDVEFEVDIVGGTAGFRVWVDWNQDGVFDTTEEVAYASSGYSTNHIGSFTVPADALVGDTRMRIVSHWLSTTGDVDPCETGFTYGEFEDYKFTVEAGTGGGGGGPCSQGTASNNIENGWGNVSLLIYANDFVVVEDEEFTLEEMVVNFLLEPGFDIVSADIFFYEDTGGNGPGAEIPGTSSLGAVPVSQEIIDVHPAGFNLIEGIWTLDTPITFEGAAGDAVYWMGIEIEYAGASAFLETSSIYNTPNESYFSDDGGVTWTSGLVNFGDDMHGVITFSGQCEASGGGGGTACEQVFYDAVQPTGVGFSSGNAVANDITVAAGESFTMETMTFDVVNIAGLPSEFDLEIYEDNGSGGVGTTTGMTYHFDSSNMTFVENGTFSIYTQYTVTLTLPNIELTADASEDARYWLAIAADLTTTGDFTYWVSYDYVTNPDSYPSWQYNDTDGWFVYDGGSSEGIMTVSGMCEGAGSGDGCEWTVIVQDTSWGDEVEWELREIDGTVLLSGGGYGNGYYDEQSVTAAGPLEFWITNDGFFGDNTPTYSVSNGTEVLVSGTLETAETLIFSDLNCDSGDPGITYCEPELDCSDGDMITNVTFQEIDNTTGCSPNGYGDYTHLVATVESGETYPISVTVGDGWHNESVSVWIDFDNSGTFDEDEFFFIGTGSDEALTGDIDIPTELAEGQYRMRVRVAAVGAGTATWDMACDESQGYGETEDYTVEVGIGGGGGSDCISTIYDGGNNGSPGGAVYFDVTVDSEDIELTSIDLNIDGAGTGFTVDVYTIEGTHVGNETNQGAWTMRTSGSGTSAGEGSPSTATLDDTFVLSANTTYGIALVLDGTHSHYYTNGDGTNEHFENSDLALDLGAATNTPFSGTVFTPRVFNGGLCYNVGGGGTGDDCDQGDDSNGFENGYNITAGGDFRNADDFIVSAGNTLNVRSIVLNVFANEPVSSVNINFFEDDGGMPGSTIVESVSGLVPYAQVPIGSNFGYTIYGVYLEVDLNFAGGASGASYWMQPEAVTDVAFWEVTSVGSLGELIHTSEAMGPWTPDVDGVNHAVFKLHCEVVTAPDPGCLFDITASVEPITRVVLAGIDNTSSAVVNGSPALEDFTHIEGTMGQGTEYDIALEGNTDGNWTNYFTVWIDWDQNGVWEADEMYEIGSITNSTGTDGQQATGTITVPADAPLGSTTMRVIKSFGSSPTDPCGQYSFGQGEDYTIIVEEGVGIDDQSMTTFTYYPNPTSGIVNITANKDISSVSVVNILGQQVIATKSLDNGQVDLSALATGTYMFRVTFEDGSLETFKVLKE